ncbi:hypothetical protein H0X10_02540 [Candidatus Saccharibacteria bacterium]|nr:hypothetical protein [Candidatus Saccharibacteria bacterium]
MSLLRFHVGEELELKHDLWVHDKELIGKWRDEQKLQVNDDIVLINHSHERMYKIAEINTREVHLMHVTDLVREGTDNSAA